jgi:hypothetical protein
LLGLLLILLFHLLLGLLLILLFHLLLGLLSRLLLGLLEAGRRLSRLSHLLSR